MDNTMTLVKDSPKIDVTTWFDGEARSDQVTEMVKEAFIDEPPILYFTSHVSDPVMIRVELPLAATAGDMVQFDCSLEALVDVTIDCYINFRNESTEDEEYSREICSSIVARLRELADKLEGTMKEPVEQS